MNATGKKIVEGLDFGHSMGIIHSTGGRTTNQLVDLARRGRLRVVNPAEPVVYHAQIKVNGQDDISGSERRDGETTASMVDSGADGDAARRVLRRVFTI